VATEQEAASQPARTRPQSGVATAPAAPEKVTPPIAVTVTVDGQVVQVRETTLVPETADTKALPPPAANTAVSPAAVTPDPELLARLLYGLALVGVDHYVNMVRSFQHQIDTDPTLLQPVQKGDQATQADLLRYTAVGGVLWGGRLASRMVRSGLELGGRVTGVTLDTAAWAVSNPLLKPVRQPADDAVNSLKRRLDGLTVEGRREEETGRVLATSVVEQTIEEIIDYLSRSEPLAELVREQLSQQSTGIATSVAETARTATNIGDNAVEGFVRRLFGKTPRAEMPASPVVGKPQTMYDPAERLGHSAATPPPDAGG
jgi:hypothetical protein